MASGFNALKTYLRVIGYEAGLAPPTSHTTVRALRRTVIQVYVTEKRVY